MFTIIKFVTGVALLTAAISSSASDVAILRNGFSIRHERRDVLGAFTRLYTAADASSYVDVSTDQIDHFEKDFSVPPPATKRENPKNLNEIINTISDRHHLDPDLINSVIHAESAFNPRAVSPKGAQGLMQLMPGTASQLGVRNAFDPHDNVEGGTSYLRQLLEQYNFDLIKALAAYNAGPHRVQRYRGVPPYYETRAYVARIVREFNRKKLAEQKASSAAKNAQSKTKGHPRATVMRAIRWKIFLRPVRPRASAWGLVAPTLIGFTGLAMLGRPGELIRPYLIARRENLSFSSQLAAWAVERIFDIGAFTFLLLLTVFFARAPRRLADYHSLRESGLVLTYLSLVLILSAIEVVSCV